MPQVDNVLFDPLELYLLHSIVPAQSGPDLFALVNVAVRGDLKAGEMAVLLVFQAFGGGEMIAKGRGSKAFRSYMKLGFVKIR